EAERQTVHRIVKLTTKRGTTSITTRGDANTTLDLGSSSLSGTDAYRVERVLPLVGYPAVWLSAGNHGTMSIGLGVLLLIAAVIVAIRPSRKTTPLAPVEKDDRDLAGADAVALDQHPKVPTR
ncbi:MAG: hypothetical protein QOH68_649, partial [Nocardioidaceae bacterium]|nr:hypothetical protein [Nocardioidaceae bacterium]